MIKNPYITIIMCIVCILCFVETFAHADINTPIKSASEYNYPPFCIVSKDKTADGFSVELLRAALQAVDLDVEFKVGPWAEIQKELKDGKVQVLPLVGRTPEREAIFDFTFKYLTLHGAIFVRKGDTRIKTAGDLADKEIIVMQGDNAEEFVKRERVSPHIISVETYDKAMKLLESGKHDAVIAQRLMGIQLLKNLGISGIVPVKHRLDKFRQDFSFAVREGDKELLALLNEGLSIVMVDGTFERLHEKWFAPILGKRLSSKDVFKYALIIGVPIILFILVSFTFYLRAEVKRKTKGLYKEIEERKKAEEDKESLMHNMGERVKELQCLYSIAESIRKRKTVKEIFMDIVALIPAGWHYPDITRGKIRFEGQDYVTEPFEETAWRQTSDILTKGKLSGSVEVYYLEERPELDEGPFLSEERNLIDGIAQTLSEAIERKKAEDNLKQVAEKLSRSNTELERFAYIASHDLKEPLRTISSFVTLLQQRYEDKLDKDAGEFMDFIVNGTDRMGQLIDDLLAYARVSAVKNLIPVDCNKILVRSISNLTVVIEENRAKVTFGPLPTLMANDMQIELLFQNLINNGIKFHGEEKPHVHISAIQKKREWVFTIKDNGIGIQPGDRVKIFNIFQRLHGISQHPGTGIGLAICKKIVDFTGGKIWVESEPGQGSVFLFTIPGIN